MPTETLATYNTQPSSADYIVQGINSYFARQREDQLAAADEKSKMFGYLANQGLLRRAKPGEKADGVVGGIPWMITGNAKDEYTIMNIGGQPVAVPSRGGAPVLESWEKVKKAGQEGQVSAEDVFQAKMTAYGADLTGFASLPVTDKNTIINITAKRDNNQPLTKEDLASIANLGPEGVKVWGGVEAKIVKGKTLDSRKGGWSVKGTGSLAKQWKTPTAETLSRKVSDVSMEKSKEKVKDLFKRRGVVGTAANLLHDVNKVGWKALQYGDVAVPGSPRNTAFSSSIQNFMFGDSGGVHAPAPWSAPQIPQPTQNTPEAWDAYYRQTVQPRDMYGQ